MTKFGESENVGFSTSISRLCKVELFHAAPSPASAPVAAKPQAFNAKWTSNPRTTQPTVSPSPFVSTTGTSNTLSTVSPTVTPSPSVPGVGLWMFRALNTKASPTEEITKERQKTTNDERYLRKKVSISNQATDFANPAEMQSHVYFFSCPTNYSGIEISQTKTQHRLCRFGFENHGPSSINITADHNYEILVKANSTEDEIKSLIDELEISMGEEVTARLLSCDPYKYSGDMIITTGTISKYDLVPSDSVSSTRCNQLNRNASDSRCFVINSSSTVYYNPDASPSYGLIDPWYGSRLIFPFTSAENEIKYVIRKTIEDGCTNGIFNASGISKCQIFEDSDDDVTSQPSPPDGLPKIEPSLPTPTPIEQSATPFSGDDVTSKPSPTNVTGVIEKQSPIRSLWPLAFLFAMVVFALILALKKRHSKG